VVTWSKSYSGFVPETFLKENYLKMYDRQIAKQLTLIVGQEVTQGAVKKKRQSMGWTKPEDWQGPDDHDDPPEPADDVVTEDNEAEVNYATGWLAPDSIIQTLDELRESHGIPEEKWVLAPRQGRLDNVWTTTRADPDGPGFQVFQNHQVKARFLRKNPEAVVPFFRPLSVDAQYEPPTPPRVGQTRTMLAIGDAQVGFRRNFNTGELVPFHDARVLDVALQVAVHMGVDDVVFGGDQVDFTECSTYDQEVEFYQTTWPSLLAWHWWLRQYRELLPNADIEALEGNHDARLRREIQKALPWALNLKRVDRIDYPPALSWQNLLALDALNIRSSPQYPNEIQWKNKRLGILHSDVARATPGATGRKLLDEYNGILVFFHIHTEETIVVVQSGNGERKQINQATCPGCACYIDGRVPGSEGYNNWTNGFALIDYVVGGTEAIVHPVRVIEGETIVYGKRFVGRDRSAEEWGFIKDALLRNEEEVNSRT
jgi:hypothetical protein